MSTKARRVKAGDKWSRLSYGTVEGFAGPNIRVRNEAGNSWEVGQSIFEDEFDTVQYDEVRQVTRTDMQEIVLQNPSVVMLVEFRKQAEARDLVAVVMDLLHDPTPVQTSGGKTSKIKVSKVLKEPTAGKKRTMIGRHNGTINESGRIDFVDMEVTKGSPLRQIDPRTIDRVVVRGVCFELK